MLNKKTKKSSLTLPKRGMTTKSKIEWVILILLVSLIPIAIWSNLFAYGYYYLKCEDKPLELAGKYYRIPGDEGYGIRPGSDYSNCSYGAPSGAQRDPSTKVGKNIAKKQAEAAELARYTVYTPKGYIITPITKTNYGDRVEANYTITTDSRIQFRVREMKKDSIFSYTNLCSKPAEGSWSGTVIGKDDKGREICRTNISKYIKDYIVGVNIGNTAIMLQTPNASAESLNAEVTAIFSAMEPHSGQ